MKKSIGILITVFVFATVVSARIGETLEQCRVRYGKESPSGNQLVFIKAGWIILLELHNGKVDMISFRKTEKNVLDISMPISDNEIQYFLKQNSGGKTLIKTKSGFANEWQTEDAQLYAVYDKTSHFLGIFTREFSIRSMERKKAEENKKLNGF